MEALPMRALQAWQTWIVWLYLGCRPIRWVTAVLLGGSALCSILGQLLPGAATIIVHVNEPRVVVAVDDQSSPVEEARGRPLEFRVPAGAHRLRMTRHNLLLQEKAFTVDWGERLVLTAQVPPARRVPASYTPFMRRQPTNRSRP
jgi:hypothetical protein